MGRCRDRNPARKEGARPPYTGDSVLLGRAVVRHSMVRGGHRRGRTGHLRHTEKQHAFENRDKEITSCKIDERTPHVRKAGTVVSVGASSCLRFFRIGEDREHEIAPTQRRDAPCVSSWGSAFLFPAGSADWSGRSPTRLRRGSGRAWRYPSGFA